MNWNWAVSQATIINQSQSEHTSIQSFRRLICFDSILFWKWLLIMIANQESREQSCFNFYILLRHNIDESFIFSFFIWKWSRKLKTVKNSTIDLAAMNKHTHCMLYTAYWDLVKVNGRNSLYFLLRIAINRITDCSVLLQWIDVAGAKSLCFEIMYANFDWFLFYESMRA